MEQVNLKITAANLEFNKTQLWKNLNLDLKPGEFLAVLGPNGSGKSSLLKAILGIHKLSQGSIEVLGSPATLGNRNIGYIPQQKPVSPPIPLRVKDFITMGIDGSRWGFRIKNIKKNDLRTLELLSAVGLENKADTPINLLSGGEQQRARLAQALATNPKILLCDEALLSLDLYNQKLVSSLVHQECKNSLTSVIFVTHEINPIIEYVDRVLYFVSGNFVIGTAAEVINSRVLSELYQTNIEVIYSQGRAIVLGTPETFHGSETH